MLEKEAAMTGAKDVERTKREAARERMADMERIKGETAGEFLNQILEDVKHTGQ
jgi:hypothetical protein